MSRYTNLILIFLISFFILTMLNKNGELYSQESNKAEDSIDMTISDGAKQIDRLKEKNKESNRLSDDSAVQEDNQKIGKDQKEDSDDDYLIKSIKELESQFLRPLYNSRGKRDPFKPFIQTPKEKNKAKISKSTPPLKRYSLNQFRIVGIVWMDKSAKAMIVDPEKNTYFLGIDDEIGNKDGKIVEIRKNGLLVEEKRYFEDVFGESKVEIKKSVLAFIEKEE
ncbi:MAG: hypothetical protein GTO02_03630 [Candidatus Dadabacteria bacterium]|nr:hypothetical protein [Candidatus Dadabacteria bacterium]NIQ13518.1 hypothetical protein [Candidatus Dadabacteria bacterium]